MKNPLIGTQGLPAFEAIRPDHVEPAVRRTLEQLRQRLSRAAKTETPSFECAEELERIQDAVHRCWGPVAHLNAVLSTPELRDAYNNCLPLITEFGTELGQNEQLYDLFSRLEVGVDPVETSKLQLLSHALRDFRLAGVALPPEARERFKDLVNELAQRQASFEQNLMDATDAFRAHEAREEDVAGVPRTVLDRARKLADVSNAIGSESGSGAPVGHAGQLREVPPKLNFDTRSSSQICRLYSEKNCSRPCF